MAYQLSSDDAGVSAQTEPIMSSNHMLNLEPFGSVVWEQMGRAEGGTAPNSFKVIMHIPTRKQERAAVFEKLRPKRVEFSFMCSTGQLPQCKSSKYNHISKKLQSECCGHFIKMTSRRLGLRANTRCMPHARKKERTVTLNQELHFRRYSNDQSPHYP